MANDEVIIQFEGFENDTATYVVLTNGNESTETDRLGETEEIEIPAGYEEDMVIETLDPVASDNVQLVPVPSGSRSKERGSRKRKHNDKEVEEWTIALPVGIIESIREPLRPYRVEKAVKGDTETTKDGVKRRHDGKRWHRLCCVQDCDRVCKKMGKCITHFNEQEATTQLVKTE